MASLRSKKIFIILVLVGLLVADCDARRRRRKSDSPKTMSKKLQRQLVLQQRETNPVNFSRLVAMRLVYGLASMMGLQERLGGLLNGAFVPPGAEDDDYSLGFDDDDDDGVDLGDYFDARGLKNVRNKRIKI